MRVAIPGKLSLTGRLSYEKLLLLLSAVYFLNNLYLVSVCGPVALVLDGAQLVLLMGIGVLFAFQGVSRNSMLLRVMVVAVFALSTLASGTFPYLKHGLVLLTGIHCSWDRTYRKLCRLYGWLVLVTILLGWTGILPAAVVRRGYSTYGFSHANLLAVYLLTVLACYLLAHRNAFRSKQYLAACLLIAAAWLLTGSRTATLSMLFLMGVWLLGKRAPAVFSRRSPGYWLALGFPLLLLGISFLLGRCFDGELPLFSAMDAISNGRLQMANSFMRVLTVPVFGQPVTGTLVENAYLTSLYHFGLIPTLLELAVYTYAIRKSLDNRDYANLACLLAMALHGMAESATFDPFYNVALLSVFSRTGSSGTITQGVKKGNDHRVYTCL